MKVNLTAIFHPQHYQKHENAVDDCQNFPKVGMKIYKKLEVFLISGETSQKMYLAQIFGKQNKLKIEVLLIFDVWKKCPKNVCSFKFLWLTKKKKKLFMVDRW